MYIIVQGSCANFGIQNPDFYQNRCLSCLRDPKILTFPDCINPVAPKQAMNQQVSSVYHYLVHSPRPGGAYRERSLYSLKAYQRLVNTCILGMHDTCILFLHNTCICTSYMHANIHIAYSVSASHKHVRTSTHACISTCTLCLHNTYINTYILHISI